jgi:tripartite-type tricarboxylate transporter receptor subunit TctC
MIRRLLLAASLSLLASAPAALAQAWPAKPITVIVAYAGGGATELMLRAIQPRVAASVGQPLVYINRPGGGGNIATDAALAAGADGYTLLVNGDQLVTTPHFSPGTTRYDLFRDLIPITRMVTVPFALLVNAGVPATTLGEFVALGKSGKAKLTYATPGNGTSNHLSMEHFKSLTGADILHVPYKGAATAMNDLMAGRIDSILISIQLSGPQVKSGKLRALAVAGGARSPMLPGVPTFAEAGVADFDVGTTFGLFAPAGASAAIVNRMHAEVTAALRDAEVRRQIEATGTHVTANSPAEFAKQLRADFERNGRIIRDRGIVVE